MVTGIFTTHYAEIAGSGHFELDLSTFATTEKHVRISPAAVGLHLLLTPRTSVVIADAEDYLLPVGETVFGLGRSSDRLSFYNSGGGNIKVYIAVTG